MSPRVDAAGHSRGVRTVQILVARASAVSPPRLRSPTPMPSPTASSTRRSDTQCVSIPVAPATVFGFVADPENLPVWAVGFAHRIRRDGHDWLVRTAQGEIRVQVHTNDVTRTVDFHLSPTPGA